ncbi:MAG: DUF4178 domain-containing protein [Bacteroidota bacterium]
MQAADLNDTLRYGIRAARRKDRTRAREAFTKVLQVDRNNEEAWLWLSRVLDSPEDQRRALEEVARLNPDNRWAAQQLVKLASLPPANPFDAPRERRLEVLQCPSCGGSVELRNEQGTKTVVCSFCGSVLDLTHEQAAIVGQTDPKLKALQPIAPGMKGTFDGKTFEVSGWIRYHGEEWDEGKLYTWDWDEWLLVAPDGDVRWLSWSKDGGFKLQRPVPITGRFKPGARTFPVPGGTARRTERDEATVTVIQGELTWQATIGNTIKYVEAVDKQGLHYSIEYSGDEVELHGGPRLTALELWTAFGDQKQIARLTALHQTGAQVRRGAKACLVMMLLFFGLYFSTSINGIWDREMVRHTVTFSGKAETVLLDPVVLRANRGYRVDLQVGSGRVTTTEPGDFIEAALVNDAGDRFDLVSSSFAYGERTVQLPFRIWQTGAYRLELRLPEDPPGTSRAVARPSSIEAEVQLRQGVRSGYP